MGFCMHNLPTNDNYPCAYMTLTFDNRSLEMDAHTSHVSDGSKTLTSFTTVSLFITFNWAVLEPFLYDMDRICSDFTWASLVFYFLTNVFHCSCVTSASFAWPASINVFNLHHVVMRTFMIMGPIHFSFTLNDYPNMSYSACENSQEWWSFKTLQFA